MWIMLNDAMFSIVEDTKQPTNLVVRSRVKGAIEDYFGVKAIETANSDYRFRCFLPREEVMVVIADAIFDIDYNNFKNSVDDDDLHDAYLDVWTAMYKYQSIDYPNTSWLNYRTPSYYQELFNEDV